MIPGVLLDRQLARLAGVSLDAIAHRKLTASHADRIERGIATIETIPERLAFVAPPYDLENIAATADEFGGELLLLDYLQRIRPPGSHTNRRSLVDALMDLLRQFADAGCVVLCVSAVARSKDKRGRSTYDGDSLSLASFRESSELEYGADSAFVLVPNEDDPTAVTLRCLKHRHGEPIDIQLEFNRSLQRFTPVSRAPTEAERSDARSEFAALWNRSPVATEDDS